MLQTAAGKRMHMVLENHWKSLIQHGERSELHLHFMSGEKFIKNAQNDSLGKTEAGGQTVFPDKSILRRQKWVEYAKIQRRHLGWFSNTVPPFFVDILRFF